MLVKYGNKGKDVKWVQESLNKLGFNCGTADGIFGSRTYSGVVAFQKYYSLTIDGIVGSQTEKKIKDLLSNNNTIIRYELQDGTHVYEVDPLKVRHVWLQGSEKRTAKDLAKVYPNFVNCMFFDPNTDILFRLFIQDEKIINPSRSYDLYKKGTLIIYTDGRVETKTLRELNPTGVKLAVQGFNLDYEANGSKSLISSIRKENWSSDVSRYCTRPGFGYNYQKGKLIIAIKTTDAIGIRSTMRSLGCIDKNGNTVAIGGDSGDSITEVYNGKVIYGTTRLQRSIFTF